MASISNDPGGRKRILFTNPAGKRKSIRLGITSTSNANTFCENVEALVSAKATGGTVKAHISAWVDELDDVLHARLAASGLIRGRDRTFSSLKTFLNEVFAVMSVKSGTKTAYEHTQRYLLAFFGDAQELRDVSKSDAERFRTHLKTEGLSEATIARRVGVARMFFAKAVDWDLIRKNPFAKVKGGSQKNKAREFFITREVAQKVSDACPDAQWRLLFALSRFGGLRCPSEHLALKWGDVDWGRRRIRVTSPKTEHHEGKGERWIPLFPELHQPLMDAYAEADEGGPGWVITRYRLKNCNLRTQLKRIIRKAGLTPWPRLFHNLRGSRETELAQTVPIHVVCAWIGNDLKVAKDHYLQVLDSHFADAAPKVENDAAEGSDAKAAQKRRTVQTCRSVPGHN